MAQVVVYVTGFRQHAGKTVTSLGLLLMLKKVMKAERIAYIKPVGQKIASTSDGISVEEDAVIVNQFAGLPSLDPGIISPVQIGSGFTKEFLSSHEQAIETEKLKDKILHSLEFLRDKDVIIAEGTGHPGVGGIVGLSNAKVANLMQAEIIFLSGGGIGKALDMLEVDLSYFLYNRNRVRGIIFNRLIPDKIPTIRQYITEDLLNKKFGSARGRLRIFGFFPQIDEIANPSMKSILTYFDDAKAIGNPENEAWKKPCYRIKVITGRSAKVSIKNEVTHGSLIIVPGNEPYLLSHVLYTNQELASTGESIAGIIATGIIRIEAERKIVEKTVNSEIPVIIIKEDIVLAEKKLFSIFEDSKLHIFDSNKAQEIGELFSKHFDLEKFLESFNIHV